MGAVPRGRRPSCPGGWPLSPRLCGKRRLVVSPSMKRVRGEAMELKVGNRVEVESESTEQRPRKGVIEEVVRRHLHLAIAFAGTTGTRASTPLRRVRCVAPDRARRTRTGRHPGAGGRRRPAPALGGWCTANRRGSAGGASIGTTKGARPVTAASALARVASVYSATRWRSACSTTTLDDCVVDGRAEGNL